MTMQGISRHVVGTLQILVTSNSFISFPIKARIRFCNWHVGTWQWRIKAKNWSNLSLLVQNEKEMRSPFLEFGNGRSCGLERWKGITFTIKWQCSSRKSWLVGKISKTVQLYSWEKDKVHEKVKGPSSSVTLASYKGSKVSGTWNMLDSDKTNESSSPLWP